MQVDEEHVRRIASAIRTNEDGATCVDLDIQYTLSAMMRLSLWERGLFTLAIERAAKSRRPTVEQRLILALFAAQPGDGGLNG